MRREEIRKREEDKLKNFYKGYNQREEEIRKEDYGLALKNRKRKKNIQERTTEKGREEYLIDKMEYIVTAFEESFARMTRINERIMKTAEDEARERRRRREQQEDNFEEEKIEESRRNRYRLNQASYGP